MVPVFQVFQQIFRVFKDMKVDGDREARTQQNGCAIKLVEDAVES